MAPPRPAAASASASARHARRIHRPAEPRHRRIAKPACASPKTTAGPATFRHRIARVTAANLGRRLGTGNVRTYPWQGDEGIRYQITLDIRQLHGGADGYAVIEAGWRAYSLPERTLKASRTFVDREPLAADGYQPLVAAQSALLSRLADDIAKSIR